MKIQIKVKCSEGIYYGEYMSEIHYNIYISWMGEVHKVADGTIYIVQGHEKRNSNQ